MFKPSDIKGAPLGGTSWVSTFMVKFTLIQTGTYRTFMAQCLSNTAHLGADDVCRLVGENQAKKKRRRLRLSARRRQCTIVHGANNNHEQHHESPLARALSWERLARVHLCTISCVYLYILIKYLLIELVSYEASSLAYLDCLVVGRFRFVGRTNVISGEIACVFMLIFLIYRWTIHSCMPLFKFYALEFMLHPREQVVQSELEFGQDRPLVCLSHLSQKQQITSAQPPVQTTSNYEHLIQPADNGSRLRGPSGLSSTQKNPIFYLRSHFELSETPTWILRPNRTEANWDALNLYTKMLFYWSIWTVVSWLIIMYWALAGSILTVLGFEIGYPACVAWLRSLQSFASDNSDKLRANQTVADYSHIYQAPKVLAHEMRVDDLPARIPLGTLSFEQLSGYYIVRVAADTLINLFVYLEFILQFTGQFYALMINSIDVILNAREINRRLEKLLAKLEDRVRLDQLRDTKAEYYSKLIEAHDDDGHSSLSNEKKIPLKSLQTDKNSTSFKWLPAEDIPFDDHMRLGAGKPFQEQRTSSVSEDQLGDEIADLQAILADHFDTLTRGYNLYISFFVTFLLFLWASYTVVVCTWMGAVKSRAIEFEFMIVEAGGTLFTVAFLSSVAVVRAQNIRLYPLIARAMAFDPDWSLTKPRWITILSYYSPRSLYCFTIFGSTELSWLLCLKLISWILSAFIVLANFYYMNRT